MLLCRNSHSINTRVYLDVLWKIKVLKLICDKSLDENAHIYTFTEGVRRSNWFHDMPELNVHSTKIRVHFNVSWNCKPSKSIVRRNWSNVELTPNDSTMFTTGAPFARENQYEQTSMSNFRAFFADQNDSCTSAGNPNSLEFSQSHFNRRWPLWRLISPLVPNSRRNVTFFVPITHPSISISIEPGKSHPIFPLEFPGSPARGWGRTVP